MTNASTLAVSFPAVAVLALNARRITTPANTIRIQRSTPALVWSTENREALKVLLTAGAKVRVLEKDSIYTLHLGQDGVIVWEERKSRKHRSFATVEVAL